MPETNSFPSPFDLPAPDDALERAEAFVRDIAFGVAQGLWSASFSVGMGIWVEGDSVSRKRFHELIDKKWDKNIPSANTLLALGYVELLEITAGQEPLNIPTSVYVLTKSAFDSLRKPTKPPNIFISYRRIVSSAFALLLEARLKIAGNPNPFVDKNLQMGDDWHGVLKARIEKAEWFISVVGQNGPDKTLDSKWVHREIEWADQAGCKIIALCHGGVRLGSCPTELQRLQGYEILEETAFQYESAVNFVLNGLGYQTYSVPNQL